MKILVIGANGKIGSRVTQLLSEHDKHTVRAMVRSREQLEDFKNKGIEAVLADLEDDIDTIQNAMDTCDGLVFAAGSGPKTGYDKTLLIDLDGAAKAAQAAERANIKRFIMVSALQANNRDNWSTKIKPYYVAKHFADEVLKQSDLPFTILRPGRLLDDAASGKIKIAEQVERDSIPRADVAQTIIDVLDAKHTIQKSYDLISGDVEIKKAIEELA